MKGGIGCRPHTSPEAPHDGLIGPEWPILLYGRFLARPWVAAPFLSPPLELGQIAQDCTVGSCEGPDALPLRCRNLASLVGASPQQIAVTLQP